MNDFETVCMNCMQDTGSAPVCPHCGHSAAEPQKEGALPLRTVLQKRYLVGFAQRSNGEGIIYAGYDTVLNVPILLHEFFPRTLAERGANGTDVRVRGGSEVVFADYLAQFLNYSRDIAHMRELSSIVRIYDIFEENHCAYTVSEYSEGMTLRSFIEKNGGPVDWNTARPMFMPVLSSLSALHGKSICHLGISPDTLFIEKSGKMKLGDFCIGAVRQMDTDLPPDLAAGCAAIEQYIMDFRPNEATDVYGFAASLFYAMTGAFPPDALKRRTDARLLIPTNILRSLPSHVVTAMANALQVSPDKRTQTFEHLRADLTMPAVTAAVEAVAPEKDRKKKKEIPSFILILSSFLIMLIIFTVVGVIWAKNNGFLGEPSSALPVSSVSSAVSESASEVVSSAAANTIKTPDLVGQDYAALIATLSSGNAQYQVLLSDYEFSDTIPDGCIIRQAPNAGDDMEEGSAVVVWVSKGAAVRTLPQITGKTLSEASAAVTEAGLVPTAAEAYSSQPEGTVLGYQDAKSGDQKPYGSSVVILYSNGIASAP